MEAPCSRGGAHPYSDLRCLRLAPEMLGLGDTKLPNRAGLDLNFFQTVGLGERVSGSGFRFCGFRSTKSPPKSEDQMEKNMGHGKWVKKGG